MIFQINGLQIDLSRLYQGIEIRVEVVPQIITPLHSNTHDPHEYRPFAPIVYTMTIVDYDTHHNQSISTTDEGTMRNIRRRIDLAHRAFLTMEREHKRVSETFADYENKWYDDNTKFMIKHTKQKKKITFKQLRQCME